MNAGATTAPIAPAIPIDSFATEAAAIPTILASGGSGISALIAPSFIFIAPFGANTASFA